MNSILKERLRLGTVPLGGRADRHLIIAAGKAGGKRLFFHDSQIVLNSFRSALSKWHDRVLIVIMLLVFCAAIRSWCLAQPLTIATTMAIIMGAMVGLMVERLVEARLAFHSFDGLLAADALNRSSRLYYAVMCRIYGVVLLTITSLIARPALAVFAATGYLIGIVIAKLLVVIGFQGSIFPKFQMYRALQERSRKVEVGILAAGILLVILLPARSLNANALSAVVAAGTAAFLLPLTVVDDKIVRIMGLAGHGSWSIITYHMKGVAGFGGLAVPGFWITVGPNGLIASSMAIAVISVINLFRILIFRIYARRFGSMILSILIGMIILISYSMPILFPIVIFVMVWRLVRAGQKKMWLLA